MNELSIIKQYPPEKFNLLGNTMVVTEVPEIMSPVMQAVTIETDPEKGDVYVQQKASDAWTDKRGVHHPASPTRYALTKNGLKKLADGAGIKVVSSESVLPTTCQKCAAVNRSIGKPINCAACQNKDVAYKVTISVPQLTGEVLYVSDTNEINVDCQNFTSDKEKSQFMKFRNEICEAKALNGAIRTALHIKGTYTAQELAKPFVVAYLVPNMNNEAVKQTAISSMFQSSRRLFGEEEKPALDAPSVNEEPVPDEVLDHFVDEVVYEQPKEPLPDTEVHYQQEVEQMPPSQRQQAQPVRQEQPQEAAPADAPMCCEKCGTDINQKVFEFSVRKYGRPLCYKCQRS